MADVSGRAGDNIPEQLQPRLPGGFHLPPFGIHQFLALMIVCVSLWALGALWLGMQAAGQWVGSWQQDIHIHVYLPADSGRGAELKPALQAIPNVIGVREISADEAATWMRSWLSDVGLSNKDMVRRLPLTFELSLGEDESGFLFADIRDAAERFGAHVNDEELNLAKVHHWLSQLGYLAWFASIVLALAMALIISNTLRMTLLARADEIHLMRLLGAREWFVRMPFILEGALIGAGAGALGWLLLWPLVWGASDWLALLQVNLNAWLLFLPLACGGALVGALGAVIATASIVSSDTPA